MVSRFASFTGLVAVLVAGGSVASAAAAHEPGPQTGAGWHVSENQHGALLRRGGIVIYIGRNCDARSPRYGVGRWGWANGGYLVTFRQRRFGFPRQDPPFSAPNCRL